MFIKIGGQRDYGNIKVDIGGDEVDIARILAEHDIPADFQLTPNEAFNLLRLSTEQCYLRELAHLVPAEAEDCKTAYAKLQGEFDAWIGKVKARFGHDQPAAA